MSKIAIFMANGCEEIEGLTVVDLLRRAGIWIDMIAVMGDRRVVGSHGIAFEADGLLEETNLADYDGIVLPGGMPGTLNLGACEGVVAAVKEFAAAGKLVSAICAAPRVLGQAGILEGKKATSYPGNDVYMTGCQYLTETVVRDGNIITSRGMGTAIPFALELIRYLLDDETAEKLSKGIIFTV